MKKIKSLVASSFWLRSFYFLGLWIVKYPAFIGDYFKIKKLSSHNLRFPIKFKEISPCLFDNVKKTGFEPHYTYHPAWAARIIADKIKPTKHIDISSILHFSTLLSAFVPTEFYDYRPAEIQLSNLECKKGDLTNLPFKDNSVESISCMHTIEHIGLGRYGDKIDPEGDIKAVKELVRVLRPGGSLLLVIPIGKSKMKFNAHRIYSYKQIIELFKANMIVKEFSLIPDNFTETGIIYNATEDESNKQDWGCGCFWLIKK